MHWNDINNKQNSIATSSKTLGPLYILELEDKENRFKTEQVQLGIEQTF